MRRITTILALALAGPALAQTSVETGARIAQEYCIRCHDVGPDGAMKQNPPSFAAIARFRSKEQIRARIWFPAIHSGMPNYGIYLDQRSVHALTDYILSLE